jgi:hypothetical protein
VLKGLGSALELGLQSALSVFGIRSAYEQPRYEVVGHADPAEIRAYRPRLAAETTLDPGTCGEAFGLLARYDARPRCRHPRTRQARARARRRPGRSRRPAALALAELRGRGS